MRLALTRLYIDAGYINSGAVIPDQTVRDGVITMQIIEGELTAIDITGNRWFRTNYLRQRLALDLASPLNIASLQQRLQFLQQDARIARLDAELAPGVQRGEVSCACGSRKPPFQSRSRSIILFYCCVLPLLASI